MPIANVYSSSNGVRACFGDDSSSVQLLVKCLCPACEYAVIGLIFLALSAGVSILIGAVAAASIYSSCM